MARCVRARSGTRKPGMSSQGRLLINPVPGSPKKSRRGQRRAIQRRGAGP
jgi:hypothetical protein